jgi:hypothetical protein
MKQKLRLHFTGDVFCQNVIWKRSKCLHLCVTISLFKLEALSVNAWLTNALGKKWLRYSNKRLGRHYSQQSCCTSYTQQLDAFNEMFYSARSFSRMNRNCFKYSKPILAEIRYWTIQVSIETGAACCLYDTWIRNQDTNTSASPESLLLRPITNSEYRKARTLAAYMIAQLVKKPPT